MNKDPNDGLISPIPRCVCCSRLGKYCCEVCEQELCEYHADIHNCPPYLGGDQEEEEAIGESDEKGKSRDINEIREALDWLLVTIGALGSLLVENDICTPEELDKRFNFCLSDWDQYSAECRDQEEAAGES